jgi:CRISPR-associated protein Cmr2
MDLRDYLRPLWKKYGHPSPYYVLILADGDYMGALLDTAKTKKEHQKISCLLEQFAQSVPDIARHYRGHCIYAGGDDVLVMVPLNNAIALAEALRQEFYQKLDSIAKQLQVETPPTLSVGMVMAHMQAPLGQVRKWADQAEKLAKGNDAAQPRNALGIIVNSRSGAELSLRIRWDDEQTLGNFKQLIRLYQQGKLPTTFGYELRQLNSLLSDKQTTDDTKAMQEIKQLELERILGRKNQQGGAQGIDLSTKQIVLEHAENLTFQAIFQQHLIAHWLSAQGE